MIHMIIDTLKDALKLTKEKTENCGCQTGGKCRCGENCNCKGC